MMDQSENRINVVKRISEIQDMYKEKTKYNNFSALVMGLYGVGKTSLICTGRTPILIDSFDPKGTLVLNTRFKHLQDEGKLFIRTFWDESSKHPVMYKKWEKMFEEDVKSGFLNEFGTYAIDSFTTWSDTLSWRISKLNGRPNGTLAIGDYIPMYNTVKDIVKLASSQMCDFIMTSHLVTVQDEITGEIRSEIKCYKDLKTSIPLLFTEKYVMYTKKTSKGVDYVLLTKPKGIHKASTQLPNLDIEEKPDLKYIMKKAGIQLEDKPPIVLERGE